MALIYYNEDAAYCFYCIKGFQQNKLLGISNMESTYISTGYKIGKKQPLDFLKLGMLLIITCQLCTYLLLTMFSSQLATFVYQLNITGFHFNQM